VFGAFWGVEVAIIGAVLGALGGFVTGCVGATLIRSFDKSGAAPSRGRDMVVGGSVAGALAAVFGIWVLAESDHDALAVVLVLLLPTALAAAGAAATAAWIWRWAQRPHHT
jgi:hypothetical protein